MMLPQLRALAQWRKPLARLQRGRFWRLYDEAYDPLLGHASLHQQWLEQRTDIQPDSLFSIGPGRGELELALCELFGCSFGYAESYAPYWKAVESGFRAAGLQHCIEEAHQGPYQQFSSQRQYDLILSVHSWYTFGYDAPLLASTLGRLTAGGSFVMTVTAKDDFFFRNVFKRQEFSAQDLSSWASEQGFAHEYHALGMPVAGSALVENGALTDVTKGVVGFLLGRFWHELPSDRKQHIEQVVLQAVADGGVQREYGLLHFRKASG